MSKYVVALANIFVNLETRHSLFDFRYLKSAFFFVTFVPLW
jgi:hypothetical protein